jgi:carbon-monoxide dehydrogenase iron sulfur subunit
MTLPKNWPVEGSPMYELKVTVTRVLGTCTADPPMKPGDYFTVRNGDIRIPEGGYICLWALQSILPLLPAKERNIVGSEEDDWMWRVHHAQCPDPDGRVIFEIERVGELKRESGMWSEKDVA